MKLAWYTPFSIHSAIGRFSHLVIRELRAQGAEVTLVRSEAKTPAIRSAAPICADEPFVWACDWERKLGEHAAEHDLLVYNLGDHYDYHYYAFQHQVHIPGLSILHDFCLHHALMQHCSANPDLHGTYLDHLYAECGEEAVKAFEDASRDNQMHQWWEHDIARYPVSGWAVRNTLGVVTHATFYRELVEQRGGSPTLTIPLAYDTVWEPPTSPVAAVKSFDTKKRTILTVGSVNANKRHQAVIQCIAHSRFLRERCQYRIVGHIEPLQQQAIERQLAALDSPVDVVITGAVSRQQLSQELATADILSCLRFPALEGASASVIEGLLTAKPVIVSNTGCYREIPNDLVYKVDPSHEKSELTHVLEQLVRHYDEGMRRGVAARKWAQQRHSPAQYAKAFVQFADEILYDKPVLAIADRIANHLQQWNAPTSPALLRRVDVAMQSLFGQPKNQQRVA